MRNFRACERIFTFWVKDVAQRSQFDWQVGYTPLQEYKPDMLGMSVKVSDY